MNKIFTYKDGFRSFSFAVIVNFAVQFIAGLIIAQTETGSVWYWIILAVCNLFLGFSAWLYSRISKTDFVSAAKLNSKPKFLHIVWACAAVVGLIHFMTPLNGWICDLFEIMGLKRPSVDLPMQVAPLIFVAGIIPAFSEEFLFRGVIGSGFTQKGMWKGALIGGALFSLFHMNPAQTLHQFVLGAFLIILVYRSGSLWTAVITHFFNNALVIVLSQFAEPTGFYEKYDVVLFFAGLVLFAGCLVGYFFTTKNCGNISSESEEQPAEEKIDGSTIAVFSVAVAACFAMWLLSLLGD